ncbi:MAG TPA: hypothetical protein PKC49_08200 [Phycisphaerae bacterium]|nr:hypothetical protein [Phycisphaerae bacterium]
MHHDPEFCRGIAMVLKGESLKAACCVTHGASLGSLRERMVARFVRDVTPGRLSVESGLVHSVKVGKTSAQCDLLVHDASSFAPLYRWQDFVIVEADAAAAVIEVKSNLNEEKYGEVRKLQDSLWPLPSVRGCIPVFCYALDGVTFDTCVDYVAATLRDTKSILAIPHCIVVQERHYLLVRPVNAPDKNGFQVYAVNLQEPKAEGDQCVDGLETGMFLELYKQTMRSRHDAFDGRALRGWFDRVKTSGCTCVSIDLAGNTSR